VGLIYYSYVVSDDLLSLRDALEVALRRANGLLQDAETKTARTARSVVDLPRTQAIEAILRESGEAMRPVEVWAKLREAGRDDPKMEVQVTTFDLWRRGRIAKLGRGQYKSKMNEDQAMSEYTDDIASMERMIEDVRRIRERTCELKSNSNPRYHALSAAVSQLTRAIEDMRAEG
jgi:hypothetical protein